MHREDSWYDQLLSSKTIPTDIRRNHIDTRDLWPIGMVGKEPNQGQDSETRVYQTSSFGMVDLTRLENNEGNRNKVDRNSNDLGHYLYEILKVSKLETLPLFNAFMKRLAVLYGAEDNSISTNQNKGIGAETPPNCEGPSPYFVPAPDPD
jgi:hypothetical protein